MKIEVKLLEGQQLQANFGEHSIISDQSVAAGGKAELPEPFDYFLASMPLCATFYMRKFCQQRDINTDGLKVVQNNENVSKGDPYKKKITLTVTLPNDFPKKYEKAMLAAANTCTVKKVIQAMPDFDITIV
ncbi:MAG: OsmC family protein [Litorilituus sp.]|jgi:ribosomal protein S12 methylthiotransferase accessory factor|nr:OsmC family protein [Litorilituus sp.]